MTGLVTDDRPTTPAGDRFRSRLWSRFKAGN